MNSHARDWMMASAIHGKFPANVHVPMGARHEITDPRLAGRSQPAGTRGL
jgi:hypothetical protein